MEHTADAGWVVIAHLTRPRGICGELRAVALSSHAERYAALAAVWVGGVEYAVEQVWYHKGQPIFKFRGIDSMTDAERLAGEDVSIPVSERYPLPPDEHYFADLVGCRLLDAGTGNPIGVVTGWQEIPGAPAVLEVDGGRVLVPFAKALVRGIDVQARQIVADLPEGLVDLNG